MNALLLNRDGFQMPEDGWYQLAPLGEFAHAQAGLIQVVDREACEAMVKRFNEEAGREPFDKLRAERFAGVLVDFDHFSLDGEKRSEAAGWITALECRPASPGGSAVANAGLWARIRGSDVGEEAVKGGRYRFLSPVWARSDCVDMGDGRVRPVRLLNAAVTNDPNLKGMRPLSNRGDGSHSRLRQEITAGQEDTEDTERRGFEQKATKGTKEDKGGGEKRFKWVLGRTESGKHCPSCVAVAGQVHTMAEWEAAGVKPGAGSLFCQGNCRCRLVETSDPPSPRLRRAGPEAGPGRVPLRRKAEMENRERRARLTMGRLENRIGVVLASFAGARKRSGVMANIGWTPRNAGQADCALTNTGWTDQARIAALAVRKANPPSFRSYGGTPGATPEGVAWSGGALANTGWTDIARAAALAVRRAKAGVRGKVEKKKPPEGEKPPDVFAGGDPFFDEETGKYVYPPEMWAPPGGMPGLPGGRIPVAGVVPKGRPPRLKHPYVPPGFKGWM